LRPRVERRCGGGGGAGRELRHEAAPAPRRRHGVEAHVNLEATFESVSSYSSRKR